MYKCEWACPTVNVMKSDGNIRICADYSLTVNKCMKLVKYLFPSVQDVIARVGDAKVFSKIDLESAYLQLPLDDESKVLMTINSTEGLCRSITYHLEFPVHQESSCHLCVKSCTVLIALSYIKMIILIMTSTKHQHDIILNKVLKRLREIGIKLKINKCSFYVNSVNYLGYIFDKDDVRPNTEKIHAIIDALTPVNVKQVQSFLGLYYYYHRFIRNFSTVFAPLYKLLKRNINFM